MANKTMRDAMEHAYQLKVLLHADAGKLLKSAPTVDYMGSKEGPFRCDHCSHFIEVKNSDVGKCELVAGPIECAGCCNKFHKES